MGQAIIGFFGSAVAAVVSLLSIAAGITFFIVAWKAGMLPTLGEGFLMLMKGIFVDIPIAILGFLRDLLTFAAS
jgi:hypothetical protein